MHTTDVVIIGTGPVGLFAIFECGMMGFQCHAVEALDGIGGQCRALYPEKPIYDIPAYPAILGGDLIDNLESQAAPFRPVYHLNQRVDELRNVEDEWYVKTSKGTEIKAKAVIVAAGVGAFGPNRPPLEGIERYEGKSVFYYVKNRNQFDGKRLVIAGGGDSAVDWALTLSKTAKCIYMVHRRDRFRAAPDSVAKLHDLVDSGKIELVTPYQLKGLQGNEGVLSGVTVTDMDGETRTLAVDALLAFFGLSMSLGPISEWGLTLQNKHITVDPLTMKTNAEGIYAVGDVADYPHKLKLILSGFSEAAQAAHQIRAQIYPDKIFHFEHSTTQGVPGALI
ncbi:MAG: NAD(P)/FAD-dependent oxidoreductase [Alphaproteobacteria bacterium]|nr:MAG: NAD(P)/FAD-dependent oxidoreductase [Alphaproteobacteria bacterium]